MKRKPSIAILVSGGLDSDVLVADLLSRYARIWPLYIRQGLAWETVELYWLNRFLKKIATHALQPLHVLALPMADVYGAHWSVGRGSVPGSRSSDRAVYLPGRNLILLAKAIVFCTMHQIPEIALAPLGHNPFADATPAFFGSVAQAARMGLHFPLKIQTPYRHLSKVQVIQRGAVLPLHLSFSCLAPRGRLHCGACNKCAERQKAFRKAGVPDKTRYAEKT